jgi:hypothetical protein
MALFFVIHEVCGQEMWLCFLNWGQFSCYKACFTYPSSPIHWGFFICTNKGTWLIVTSNLALVFQYGSGHSEFLPKILGVDTPLFL